MSRYQIIISFFIVISFLATPISMSSSSSSFSNNSTTGSFVSSVTNSSDAVQNLQSRKLTSPHAQYEGLFGDSVAISGNYVVIGASNEKVEGHDGAGRVYIYNAITSKLMHALTSPNAQNQSAFGWSVAVSGDLLIVGAPAETVKGQNGTGISYEYDLFTGALIRELKDPSSYVGGFGYSIAAAGSIVVASSPGDTVHRLKAAGEAFVFGLTNGKLISKLTSPHAETLGQFGISVATNGEAVVVGTPYESSLDAYVFNGYSGKLIHELSATKKPNSGAFGSSSGVYGNVAVIGAPDESAGRFFEDGAVYLFNLTSGKLIENLTSPNEGPYGHFGSFIAFDGKNLAVGSLEFGYAGRVYFYFREKCNLNCDYYKLRYTLVSPKQQTSGGFAAVAFNRNFIVVGAAGESVRGIQYAGHAYIFLRP